MRLLGRDARTVLRAPLQAGHWRALAGAARTYPPAEVAPNTYRFVTGRGSYPYTCHVKTPLGLHAITADTPDDLATVNEIFCRRDYEISESIAVFVDVGANVGLASLYALTRNATSRCYCMEPDPKNIARLKKNLGPYADRYTLYEAAAAAEDGETTFFVEPTGRYGGMVQTWQSESITVPTRNFNAIVREVLVREPRIDVLKVDTEGTEPDLVGGLEPDLLDRIDQIVYETAESTPLHTDRFAHSFANMGNVLVRR